MKISIAMATFNGARYLADQLDSFRSQTRLPDELVVCDDCSGDDTVPMLERFQKQVSFPVRIHRNAENLGFTQNFGKVIGLCEGDVIFPSDQDDVWFPGKLATMERVFRGSPRCLFVICNSVITNSELRPTDFTMLGQIRSAGFRDDHFNTGCCSAFRASLRSLILPIPAKVYGHDAWITKTVSAISERVVLDVPLQCHRRHESNASQCISGTTSRVRRTDQFRSIQFKTLPSDYAKEGEFLGTIIDRLNNLGPKAYQELGATRPFPDVTSRLHREWKALSRRKTLLESGWLRRKIAAVGMWRDGEYRYFRGWKSFAKDMLR